MNDFLRFTVLGCGSSPGVPRIGGDWGACDPTTRRTAAGAARCWSQRISRHGRLHQRSHRHQPGPPRAGARRRDRRARRRALHASARRPYPRHRRPPRLRHEHAAADRCLCRRRRRLARLKEAFGYCFETPPGSDYPPIVNAHPIEPGEPVTIEGKGGALAALADRADPRPHRFARFPHRRAWRIRRTSATSTRRLVRLMQGLDVWIVDALRPRPHPSHLSLSRGA